MKKAEALEKIKELQDFIEELDKPKQVRVYIKLDAKQTCSYGWGRAMDKMVGRALDVHGIAEKGVQVYIDDDHSDWFNFSTDTFVVVEGTLDSLK